jgi:glycosyltransferase involved in cell wall biosynthesis
MADKFFDRIVVADNSVYTHFSEQKTTILYNFPEIRLWDVNNNLSEKVYDVIFPGSMAKFTANIILESIKIAKDKGYTITCALISPFNFYGGREWVENRIEELGLERDNFLIKGRIPPYEVPAYIKKSKIGLIPLPDTPKTRSNIPTKLFEYMYCGIPVITGDLPPSSQFINGQGCGFLVNPSSPEEYAERIIELVNCPDLAHQMGSRGKRLVETRYNWELQEQKLKKLYESLLQEN